MTHRARVGTAPRLSADTAVLHIKLVAAHGSMVYSPRFGVTQNFPVAKWAHINVSFCHPTDKAVLHMKLVAAHGSMVYLPRFGVTQNLSDAKWAHVHVGFCHPADKAVLHRKSVPASAAMIYSTCTHGASHRFTTMRTNVFA